MSSAIQPRRLIALCRKEVFQIIRDPSSNLIAFMLPVVMLLIFGYGINLDSTRVKVGLILEDHAPSAQRFAESLIGSPYLAVLQGDNRSQMNEALTRGHIRGMVIVPIDFSSHLERLGEEAPIQVITDGSEPNIAAFVENYLQGIWQQWLVQRARERGEEPMEPIKVESRVWFNPTAESRNYLIPGSITLIMTVIGALLTSLVVAREWERGTMEALLSTPVTRTELLLSKLLPYYALGIASLLICVVLAVVVLKVPFRGSVPVLLAVATLFLGCALGMGLLISTVTRNQFNAAQAALNAAFLPAMMLSGFIYEIASMPTPIRAATHLIPARYFVNAMQTLFQAGDVWDVLRPNMLFLFAAAVFFIGLTARKTRRRLD